jgi:hypothetical protein
MSTRAERALAKICGLGKILAGFISSARKSLRMKGCCIARPWDRLSPLVRFGIFGGLLSAGEDVQRAAGEAASPTASMVA